MKSNDPAKPKVRMPEDLQAIRHSTLASVRASQNDIRATQTSVLKGEVEGFEASLGVGRSASKSC